MPKEGKLSPQGWIRYWYGAFAIGVLGVILRIVYRDVRMAAIGVVFVLFVPGMVAYWRRQAEGPKNPPST